MTLYNRLYAPIIVFSILTVPCLAAVPAGFEQLVVASGLQSPTAMTFAPDGRLFVSEQLGRLRVIKNGSLLPTPFLTVSVQSNGEKGLLGVAFDPNFATNRWIYAYYSATTGQNRLSRFRASATNPDIVEAGSEQYLIERVGIAAAAGHNGGVIHFGPDGMLYVGIGEHGEPSWAQDLNSLGGKILRLNPATYPNIIPSDNPFVGQSGKRGEIWAYGLRNPFTFAFDPTTGRMYINDVGQSNFEEVNLGARGANYGWPSCEGPCSNPGMTNPAFYYRHWPGCAITGGAFYRGGQFPAAYDGSYFFGDYCGNFIQQLMPNNTTVDWGSAFGGPVDLQVGTNGSLYALEYTAGRVTQIRYVGGGVNRPPSALISANPVSGPAPLNVAFSGSGSSDPDGDVLAYSWDFGDGSAMATGVSTSHSYSASGTYTARLTVSDGRGGTASASVSISPGNTAPTSTINAPPSGAHYNAGDTITATGTGTDPQNGTLPASAFSWTVTFQHDTHTHPFLGPVNGVQSITFQLPQTGETSTNTWYRIQLTVTDSGGLTGSSIRDILPNTSTLTLQTVPAGLSVLVDGAPQTSPYTFGSVVGMRREIGVTSPQASGGRNYEFVSWSDGGATRHFINAPAANTAYTVTFRQVAADTTPPVITNVTSTAISSTGATISWTTDESADTQVDYGPTSTYGSSTPMMPSPVTSHSQQISGLQASTLYHYRVRSKDAAGNPAVSGDFTFTTLSSATNEVTGLIRESCAGYTNCFTSLFAWEAAYGGISFGSCPVGNLVCANKTAVAQIDGAWVNPDAKPVLISGWTTDATNYIRIYTTPAARHNGKWDDHKYRLVWASGYSNAALDIEASNVQVDGLQIYSNQTRYVNNGLYSYNLGGAAGTGEIRISSNIIRGTSAASSGIGLFMERVTTDAAIKIWNNIVYDFPSVGIRDKGYTSGGVRGHLYVYNNLVYHTGVGIYCDGGATGRPATIFNNIAAGNTTDYNGVYIRSENNISRDGTSPNAGYRNRTVIFIDEAGRDFHLAATDTAARDQGLNLSGDPDLAFSTDCDGQTRTTVWDIGPDEFI